MKLRHAIAVALVGWYLLMPPLDHSYKPQSELPISKYRQQSFESAEKREDAKHKYVDCFIGEAKKNATGMSRYFLGIAQSIQQGICIASDDPRLQERPK